MPLLETKRLSKNFGGICALNQIDLHVNQGEIIGLIGPNGAGKTTFFNVVAGVYSPSSGEVIFKGERITGQSPHTIAKNGIVRTFQATTLFEEKTTLQNLIIAHYLQSRERFFGRLFRPQTARTNAEDIKQKSLGILNYFGLAALKNELAKNLSYGHKKLLAASIALAVKPELLLLDEPVAGLNPLETLTMVTLIKGLRDMRISIIVVEHNMRAIMSLSDRITVLNHGTKIAEGSPEEIRENPDVIEAYLGKELR